MAGGTASTGYSRRGFLGRVGLGAGAVVVGRAGGAAAAEPLAPPPGRPGLVPTDPQHFGRLFPRLEPFAPASNGVRKALLELGAQGGPLDARDALGAGPVRLITDAALSAGNPDNPEHSAGMTFLGQFIDHDITFDTSSALGTPTEPERSPNGRTPSLDLDSVYGGGPASSPALYDTAGDPAKLLTGSGGTFEDLPRMADGRAIVGDPRNEEHVIIAGLQCACIAFHNRAVDEARERGAGSWQQAFAEARRMTTWHYQWIVLHEFLPATVGQAMVDDVLARGRRFYRPAPGQAYMPVEFAGACYRFGHSQVRPSYRANLKGDGGAPFFDFGDGQVKHNKRIDTKVSTPLFTLPLGAIASHDQPTVLPQRTLLRHLTWSLPSGQSVAEAMGVEPIARQALRELKPYGFEKSTPLWYYTLKEAELLAEGLRLGPVGGRIVAEVLIGLLQSDPDGQLATQPGWRPTAGGRAGTFAMTDFLAYAGVDPASRSARDPSRA